MTYSLWVILQFTAIFVENLKPKTFHFTSTIANSILFFINTFGVWGGGEDSNHDTRWIWNKKYEIHTSESCHMNLVSTSSWIAPVYLFVVTFLSTLEFGQNWYCCSQTENKNTFRKKRTHLKQQISARVFGFAWSRKTPIKFRFSFFWILICINVPYGWPYDASMHICVGFTGFSLCVFRPWRCVDAIMINK